MVRRYFLRDPQDPTDILKPRGQAWDEPIYKAEKSNRFYILQFVAKGPVHRGLFPFDASTGESERLGYQVPDDWRGEPRVYNITDEDWTTLCTSTTPEEQVAVDQVFQLVREGDIVRVRSSQDSRVLGILERFWNGSGWSIRIAATR